MINLFLKLVPSNPIVLFAALFLVVLIGSQTLRYLV
jgi:hypothetical protein